MKYQTEYQRNYQRTTHVPSIEERKLSEVPFKRSPSRRRVRSVPSSPDRNHSNENFAVIGPNDKFSESHLYRLKQPVKDIPRVAKSQEYALLGRNEKFEPNVVYPLRRPVISNSPRVVVRRRKKENHSCGIQTELNKTTNTSNKRENNRDRKRNNPQSEYRTQYNWTKPSDDIKDSRSKSLEYEQYSDNQVQPSSSVVKTSVAVNTPARVEIDVNKTKATKGFRPKREKTNEHRTRYKQSTSPKKPKAFEAEQIDDRKRKEIEKQKPEHPYSDDEGISGNVEFGNEFRQKYPHGKLRRWKSEYQSTYKPFWRFDYKNGKWYKDNSEENFNPNLFWYQELLSTRKRANEYRANAEKDHFNREHTLQLQTGFSVNNNCRAWDVDDNNDTDSVISIDRDLERERIEGERRREKDAKRNEEERIQYKKPKPIEKPLTLKADQISQTDHKTDRIIYIDEPPIKPPSVATKAFVRNLGSSSIQQHMNWDSESLNTQRTNSDIDSHRKHRIIPSKKQESRGTGTSSPLSNERQQKNFNNDFISSPIIPPKETNILRPTTSYQETTNATGRPSYDTHVFEKRPYTSTHQYCTYPGSRFKDEVTEYYYGGGDENRHTPVSKPSFQNHLDTLDDRPAQQSTKDDDVLSINSARSLSSSCSLASQTLERAQQNMNKYWGDDHSPKKASFPKH